MLYPSSANPFRLLSLAVTACLLFAGSRVLGAQPREIEPIGFDYSVDYLVPDDQDRVLRRVSAIGQACLDCAGQPVSYTAFDGTVYPDMIRYEGRHVALIVPAEWPSPEELDGDEIRLLIDRSDLVYEQYRELIGGLEPNGSGLLDMALVESTCGFGCGWIGSKGVEVLSDDWAIQNMRVALDQEQVPLVIAHEIVHNFDIFFGYLAYTQDHGHAWTIFFQAYAAFYSRAGTQDETPEQFLGKFIDEFRGIRDDPIFDWQTCVRDSNCGLNQRAAWGGLTDYWGLLHGPDAVKGMLQYIADYKSSNPAPATPEAKSDLHVAAMAAGSFINLGCYVDQWNWYASPALRAEMEQLYGSFAPNCQDGDDDGFTSVQDDCDDSDGFAFPGALETGNGIDDDCNGLVDDQRFLEPAGSDFPPNLPVSLTAHIEGEITAGDGDFFTFDVPEPADYTFTLCSTPPFQGWMFLKNEDGTSRDWQFVGSGGCTTKSYALDEARTWTFAVQLNAQSNPGPYTLEVFPALEWPAAPWATAQPATPDNGRLELTVDAVDPSMTPLDLVPTLTRFWVTGVGLVGEVPFEASSQILWLPDPGLEPGLYGYRAQALAGETPVVDFTPWQTFVHTPTGGDPTHLRVSNTGQWLQLKLGYSPASVWGPTIDPVAPVTATELILRLKDFSGTDPWNDLWVAPGGNTGIRRSIGAYTGATDDWFDVQIPLTDFPAGSFENISHLSLPFTSTADAWEIGIARVEFRGPGGAFVWFGEPEKTDNSFLGSGQNGELLAELVEGGPSNVAAQLSSPVPGSTLSDTTETFQWTNTFADVYRVWFGTMPGSAEWASHTVSGATEITVTNLPSDGSTIYVTLWSDFGPETLSSSATYTATSVAENLPAELTDPTPGAKLPTGPVTFGWTDGLGAESYRLIVSDVPPTITYFQQTLPVGTTSVVAAGLPEDGQDLLVTLETDFGLSSETLSYAYTAAGGATGEATFFRIENPVSGWRHFKLGYGTDHIWAPTLDPATGQTTLRLTLRGRRDVNDSGPDWSNLYMLPASDPARGVRLSDWLTTQPIGWFTVAIPLSAFPGSGFSGISHFSVYSSNAAPFTLDLGRVEFGDGATPFVWFGAPEKTDNAFLGSGGGGELVGELMTEGTMPDPAELFVPTPGSTLPSDTVTFEWTSHNGIQAELSIGSSPGAIDIVLPLTVVAPQTSVQITGLPTDGRQLFVRLRTLLSPGDWIVRNYTYTAFSMTSQAPQILSPIPGSVLPGSEVTFSWTDTAPRFRLEIGSTAGVADLYAQFVDSPNATVQGLPTDGRTLYVRVGGGSGDDPTTYDYTSENYLAWNNGGDIPTLGQYFRLRVNGGWGHFKLSHNATSLWGPAIDPTSNGATHLELTLRDVWGNADWDRLLIAPEADSSAGVTLGNYIEGQPTEWTTIAIPLSAFPDGALASLSNISLPFSNGAAASEILLARAAFVGAGTSFVWFGEPEQTDNVFEDGAAIEATVEEGGGVDLMSRSTIAAPVPTSRFPNDAAVFVWTETGADSYRLRVGPLPNNGDYYDVDHGSSTSAQVGGLPLDGSQIWVTLESRYGGASVISTQSYWARSSQVKTVCLEPGEYDQHGVLGPVTGLMREDGSTIGSWDDPSVFDWEEHVEADNLWFTSGFLSYDFPTLLPAGAQVESLSYQAEIASEAPGVNMNWPSELRLSINGVPVDSWVIPGDPGDRPGLQENTKPGSKYGWLSAWQIGPTGTFFDRMLNSQAIAQESASGTNLAALGSLSSSVTLTLEIPGANGLAIYGDTWGDYDVDTCLMVGYSLP